MRSQDAIAEVFITALKGLPKEDREKSPGRGPVGPALIESRRDEPSRSFREFLAEKQGG